ncbi:hypothetical protein QTP88_006982 [Uroleucon formosanum]
MRSAVRGPFQVYGGTVYDLYAAARRRGTFFPFKKITYVGDGGEAARNTRDCIYVNNNKKEMEKKALIRAGVLFTPLSVCRDILHKRLSVREKEASSPSLAVPTYIYIYVYKRQPV